MKLLAIKRKQDFEKIIKEGQKVVNSHFVIYYLPSFFFKDEQTKFGISVGKKIGNAVNRNFFKRRIRHILRSQTQYPNQKYVIIIMRPVCKKASFQQMQDKLNQVLQGVK